MITPREQRRLLEQAGFTLSRIGSKHFIFKRGSERIVVSKSKPTNRRIEIQMNHLRDELQRQG